MGSVTNYCNACVVLVILPSFLSPSCDVYTARKKEHKRLLTAMQLTNAFLHFSFLIASCKVRNISLYLVFSFVSS